MSSSNRSPYLTSETLDQDFLDDCHDNLTNKLEMVCEIDTPTGTLYLSNSNKYVGENFYEARVTFPVISRTLGEWLTPTLEFSTIKLEINNADGRFNSILPGGDDYDGFIQRRVTIKLGLRDVEATYTPIFRGRVTDVGGASRTTKSIELVCRDDFDLLNSEVSPGTFETSEYPDLEDNFIGKMKPYIYGDWSLSLYAPSGASVPAIPVNGKHADTQDGSQNLELVISANINTYFDTAKVVIERAGEFTTFDSADIANVSANKNYFEIKQSGSGGITLIGEAADAFEYRPGDKIFVVVKGKDIDTYDDNIVAQAKDLMTTFSDMTDDDLDSNWEVYRDKASPAESAISTFKSRIYLDKPFKLMHYVLQLFEQVRLEAFITRDLTIKIRSLHLDEFEAEPDFIIRNWDVEKDSFKPVINERINYNRLQGFFNHLPDINDNYQTTPFFTNQPAITQAQGKVIEKGIVFPNLYQLDTVKLQVQEILKLTSAYFEEIPLTLTWRSLLLEPGDFVRVSVEIGSVQFLGVPAMVRDIGYDRNGMRIPAKLWSFQMVPFPGWDPGYSGIVGGDDATITEG